MVFCSRALGSTLVYEAGFMESVLLLAMDTGSRILPSRYLSQHLFICAKLFISTFYS